MLKLLFDPDCQLEAHVNLDSCQFNDDGHINKYFLQSVIPFTKGCDQLELQDTNDVIVNKRSKVNLLNVINLWGIWKNSEFL